MILGSTKFKQKRYTVTPIRLCRMQGPGYPCFTGGSIMSSVRQAAVAGLFYPVNAAELSRDIIHYLNQAGPINPALHPKAIIVPHAGYIYSGTTAASAYASIRPIAKQIRRVVLLGPAHRVRLRGMAVMDIDYFQTPLGNIPQDSSAISQLLTLPQIQVMDSPHWQEHSLEVQLPFLQLILPEFTLVPIAMGDTTSSEVRQALDMLWGGPETLIVISSDLSHYHDYSTAQYIDRSTCQAIEKLDIEHIDYQQACGCTGVQGLLLAAKQRNMKVHTLALCNSGDTAGSIDRVVGYGSWAFCNRDDN